MYAPLLCLVWSLFQTLLGFGSVIALHTPSGLSPNLMVMIITALLTILAETLLLLRLGLLPPSTFPYQGRLAMKGPNCEIIVSLFLEYGYLEGFASFAFVAPPFLKPPPCT